MPSLTQGILSLLGLATAVVSGSCGWKPTVTVTEADSAAIHHGIESTLREMIAGAHALNPDRLRAEYVEQPVVAINGQIVEHYDRDQFPEIRRWLGSLRQFDATYDHVHVQVLSPSAAVATMLHHLRWTDTAGVPGEFNSAWTAVFRQVNGRWKIAYSHESRAVHDGQ
jgi:SnoaL-like protein